MTFSSPPSGFIAPANASYGSCSSWGTAPSTGHAPSISPPAAWMSERSKSPLSLQKSSVAGPSPSPPSFVGAMSPSWGSQVSTLHGSWGSPSPGPPSYLGSASSVSTASSATLVNSPIGVQTVPKSGYPATLTGVAPTPIYVHPALQDARYLHIDMAGPQPILSSNQYMSESAFTPSMTYMDLFFEGSPQWTLRLHSERGLSVYGVVVQIWHYLQGKEMSASNPQSHQRPTYGREYSPSSSSFNGGSRKADVLGRRTKFIGLRPANGANGWVVCFAS